MCCYEAHVLRDPDDGRLRMWYQDSDVEAHYRDRAEPGSAEGHADFCRYAESEDGVHWHKPRLGLLRHRGTDRNNIVLAGVRECDRAAVVLNPDPDDRERRYIMGYLDQPHGGERRLPWPTRRTVSTGARSRPIRSSRATTTT